VEALFVSDLHLDAERPSSVEAFLAFLRGDAARAAALYILGDLFEAWIGDDDDNPTYAPIIDGLATLTASGVSCYFMHGNRDFLVGQDFADRTGCRLLGDWHVIEIASERVLLTHGDLLCTDDLPYQELRRLVRDPQWQKEFLSKSLAERRAIADELRQRSRTETAAKPAEIMDVNAAAVAAALRENSVRTVLHGHTHRPGVHTLACDGEEATRIVLGAWYERGSVVRWNDSGYRLDDV